DFDACTVEHRPPIDELGAARLAEPRATLGEVGLELEEIPTERPLEPGQRGLDAVGGPPKGGLPAPRRARVGIAARPPLEQAAERERRDLDREQLADEAVGRYALDRVLVDHGSPFRLRRERRHTSTTTGRIIGRRRVRS